MKDKLLHFLKSLNDKYKDDITVLKQKSTLNALSSFCIENQITSENAVALLLELANDNKIITNIHEPKVYPFDAYFILNYNKKKELTIREELISDLDDKRITKLLKSNSNLYYLSRKETADFLLDKYDIKLKSTSSQ